MDQVTNGQQTLTLQDVCQVLRVTRHTALTLIGRGELTAFKVGAAWRIERGDLRAYIERQKQALQRGRSEGNVG